MSEHTVTSDELNKWLSEPKWEIFASSSSVGGFHKRLEVDLRSRVFMVKVGGKIQYMGMDRSAAIQTYNSPLLSPQESGSE